MPDPGCALACVAAAASRASVPRARTRGCLMGSVSSHAERPARRASAGLYLKSNRAGKRRSSRGASFQLASSVKQAEASWKLAPQEEPASADAAAVVAVLDRVHRRAAQQRDAEEALDRRDHLRQEA